MPMTVKDQVRYMLDFEERYISQLDQDAAHNAYGMHTLKLAEKANMLGLMRNWISDHDHGTARNVFTEAFHEFTRPLHTRQGKAELQKAAEQAHLTGETPLQAQIRMAHQLRTQGRKTLFDWKADVNKSAATVALEALDKAVEARRLAHHGLVRNKEGNIKLGNPNVTSVSAADPAGMAKGALQACVLDALLHKYKEVRLLFTTWKLVEGTMFLRVLASSQTLYDKGFIMNPMILRANAPSASAINWDIRLNDFFLHSGIAKNAAFVFVTPNVEYDTFLDRANRNPKERAIMIANPIGAAVPGISAGGGGRNFPVKPGGSEILTLLEYGYGVEPQDARFYKEAQLGFVMVPGRSPGRRRERFLQMHATYTEEKYRRLMSFMMELQGLGIYH